MVELVLVRGLPGSGKSTLARKMAGEGYVHVESDMFHTILGRYQWRQERNQTAHDWCLAEAIRYLGYGASVVVSNTFTRLWEMQPYLDLKVPTRVLVATGNWQNVHEVPEEVIERMRARWEPYPGEKIVKLEFA